MRRLLAAPILLGAALLLPATTLGHAELVSSDPADGATIQGPTGGPFTLVFSEALAEGSKADLSADNGSFSPVTTTPDAADPTRMVFGEFELILPETTYTIEWTSVADDGDILRGTIHFTIEAAPPTEAPTLTPEASPSEAPTAAPSPSAEPTPAPSAQPGDGGDSSAAIIPIIVGLALVGAAAWWLVVRRRPSVP